MKRITLLVASILVLGNTANAEVTQLFGEKSFITNFNDEPITFIERGISFYVFPDGQFDFNTEPTVGDGDLYYKNGKRSSSANVNNTYGAPGVRRPAQGIRIEHDSQGRIRRIGNVFINYDAQDRIKRIGSVYMTYNRYALSQVGGLQLIYSRNGQIIDTVGSVKGNAYAGNTGSSYYYGSSSNYGNNSNDNYYYKTNATNPSKK